MLHLYHKVFVPYSYLSSFVDHLRSVETMIWMVRVGIPESRISTLNDGI